MPAGGFGAALVCPPAVRAIESTCRQYQCRFKRTGQLWTEEGDEALMTVETIWYNGRLSLLFPHSSPA